MDDLSAGDLPKAETAAVNLGLEEQAHRIRLQTNAFNAAILFAVVLLMVAVVLAFVSLQLYAAKDAVDWHVTLLVAAVLVPATVTMVAAVRAAFPKAVDKDEDLLPTMKALKELKELLAFLKNG